MKKIIQQLIGYVAAMLLVLSTTNTFAQYISNPSFETPAPPYDHATGHDQVDRCKDWFRPSYASSDYWDKGGHFVMQISPNINAGPYSYKYAQHGDRHVGMFMETDGHNQKEYVATMLPQTLTAGVTYTIKFYTLHVYQSMIDDNGNFQSDIEYRDLPTSLRGYLGVGFSATSPEAGGVFSATLGGVLDSWNPTKRALVPASNQQVYGTASRNTWVPVTLTYTADGTENYMMVGQFNQLTATGLNGGVVYYAFDNFSMEPAATTPVATGTNPTTPTGTGSVSLSAATGSYPANTPVTVTYTKPDNTTGTYTGTTDGTGKITIPNLPVGTYPGFVVSVNGGPASNPSNSVTLVAPPATPVPTGTNPTTPGGTNGSVSLSPPSGSSYPANTPVTVTYTKPDNTTATYSTTSDGTGKVTIPNLPAGTYTNFTVAFNGGPASAPSNSVTLVAPPATPVPTGTNPTTPGGTNGSVSLSPPSGSSYPANTPVTVTYTRPDNTTATYSGSSDGTGKVTIPNLPAGTYTNFTVAFNGGAASGPSGPVTLVAPPATPVPTGTNPTTPGGTDGSVSLSPPSGSTYPANTPVTVTYTKPDNTTATYSTTSDGTGKVTIPNLPAGTYTNFTVAFNGGAASGPSGPVTLVASAVATVDCPKTQITPAPVQGTPNQMFLIVTANVTTAGTFPVSVSGSGFSLYGVNSVSTTTTGVQTFKIPVQYDGSTLGTLTFNFGSGSCTANLNQNEVVNTNCNTWTLDKCTPQVVAPVLK
ncbi:hypothetical protein [Siphonobacter sp. SORGH_AS_0500]|uniref:hypothetical protein n=1 Tax=Siphonobacter sp. SORGH_AS_0500 TaxID=1864824 RepID=UPI002862A42E|nr:hypothetical protein [Siphonobacter sp. SORGH_AS_0500]MDR6194617.1 hypothetical protein [Siphonobacter sp. SORGH_AS_0500]